MKRLPILILCLCALLLGGCTEQAAAPSPASGPGTEAVPVSTEPETAPPLSTAAPETEAPAETTAETEAVTKPPPTTEAPTEPATEPAPETTEPVPAEPFVYRGLTVLTDWDDRFIIDQRYATENNFTGVVHYDRELCLVQEDIIPMLIKAADLAEAEGCRIKVWDAYRPISVQQALHDAAPPELSAYVPGPSPYSMHARGITLDVTLCDMDGNELDMPTGFDDFSARANSDSKDATAGQIANRELLNKIMSGAGFKRSRLEWWHFDGPNRDKYEILDVSFAEYEDARRESAAP